MKNDGWLILKNTTEAIEDRETWNLAWNIFCDKIKVDRIQLSEDERQVVKEYIFMGKKPDNTLQYQELVDACIQNAFEKLKQDAEQRRL